MFLYGDKSREHIGFASNIVSEHFDEQKKSWIQEKTRNHYLDTLGYAIIASFMQGLTDNSFIQKYKEKEVVEKKVVMKSGAEWFKKSNKTTSRRRR